jgi:hypothetical protein
MGRTMGKLEELKAEIKRYVANGYHNFLAVSSEDRRRSAAIDIADAFTCPDALTVESIKAAGAESRLEGFVWETPNGRLVANSLADDSWWFTLTGDPDSDLVPQPKTVGDLYRRLEELTRD